MPLDPGTRLAGRYELLTLLGEGGSAQVYRAQDTLLGREVALKVMHAHLPESDHSRFLREVRTLARLTHPGVVAVLDLGQEPDAGRPFFTMPLLTGGPVTALGPLEDAPQPLGRFLKAASFAAEALHYVHAHGIVHRDLTPGNVLLDASGLPRLMDFGLVALSDHTRHLTRSGVTLGTPVYMAPEQAKGLSVDARSDLYALGAVLYRVACGSPPYSGDSDQSVLYQHVYEPVPDPRDLNPAVPGYMLVNLDAHVFPLQGLEVFGQVTNLLDRHYATFGVIGTNVYTANDEQFRTPAPGRAFMLGVRYGFGQASRAAGND